MAKKSPKTSKNTVVAASEKEEVLHNIDDAISFVKAHSKGKFDGSVEVHINLSADLKKQDQSIRFSTTLPHGTGKSKKVAVLASKKVEGADLSLSEGDLPKIEKGEIKPKIDFDVLIAEPRFMPQLAKVAKILGPAGVMPNPKAGTVTENVDAAVAEMKKGKMEIRTEPNAPLIHTIIGKESFENAQIKENFLHLFGAIKQNKPTKAKPDFIQAVYLSATMSPSAKVDISSL